MAELAQQECLSGINKTTTLTMNKALAIGLKRAAVVISTVVVTSCAALGPALVGGMSGAMAGMQTKNKQGQTHLKASAKKSKAAAENSQTALFSEKQKPLSYEDSLRYDYFFLEAIRQQNAGHYDAAYDLLSHSLDINPQAAEGWFYMSMSPFAQAWEEEHMDEDDE